MPNIFDQFDEPTPRRRPPAGADPSKPSGSISAPAAGALPGQNIFDQFDSPPAMRVTEKTGDLQGDQPQWKQTVSQFARPLLSGVAAAGGAILGTAASPVAGTLAGGGLGFAMGEELADLVDEWMGIRERQPLVVELVESAKDIAEGAAFEAGGQVLSAAAQPVMKFAGKILPKIPLTKKSAEKVAGEVLAANTTWGPMIAKNRDEARALEEAIPGLKFSRGQMAINSKALRDFISKQKGGVGAAGIEDIISPISRERAALERAAQSATGRIKGKAPQVVGEEITSEIASAKAPVTQIEKELWEQVPNYEMPVDKTNKAFKNAISEPSTAQGMVQKLNGVWEKLPNNLKGLQTIERQIGSAIRTLSTTPEEKRVLVNLKKAVAADFDEMGKAAERGDVALFDNSIVYPKQVREQISKIDKSIATEAAGTGVKLHKEGSIDAAIAASKKSREPTAGKMGIAEKISEELAEKHGINSDVWEKGNTTRLYLKNRKRGHYLQINNDGIDIDAVNANDIDEVKEIISKLTKPVSDDTPLIKELKAQRTRLEDILKNVEPAPDIGKAYQKAKQFSKTQKFDRFDKAAVAEIAQTGKFFGGKKIPDGKVGQKFMDVDNADQLIRAIGKKKSGDVMVGHYMDDIEKNVIDPKTGDINGKHMARWFAKHKPVLKKYGIEKDFKDVVATTLTRDEFYDSTLAKALNVDTDKVVSRMFGADSKRKAALDVVDKLKNDKKAIRGLQNATIDHIVRIAEGVEPDLLGAPKISRAKFEREFAKLKPAIDVVFKSDPKKMKALEQYRRTLNILQRGKASPLGGGSDTAENVFTAMAKQSGMTGSRLLSVVKALVSPIKNMSDKQVNMLLNRAAIDPEFAYTLMMGAQGKPIDLIEQRLKGHLAAMAIRRKSKKRDEK